MTANFRARSNPRHLNNQNTQHTIIPLDNDKSPPDAQWDILYRTLLAGMSRLLPYSYLPVQDPVIGNIVHDAMKESGESLIREFRFAPEARRASVERGFRRFQNPHLKDEV